MFNKITGCNKPKPLPDALNNKELAENFAQFFKQKTDKIRNKSTDIPQYKVPPRKTPIFKSFTTTTENDLLKLIMDMATKSCESDIIPTKLLKGVLPTVIPAITKIVNLLHK